MKLAFSNIAWPPEHDEAVAAALVPLGVRGIEVAPTKLHPDPASLDDAACRAIRRRWEDRGLPIVAAQALLFGKPELTLFESAATRRATLDYLQRIVAVCGKLGARSLVFGSPKNRRLGSLPLDEGKWIAVEFFRSLASAAHDAGTCVVMEANPPAYGADFATYAGEALELVALVDHPGFRLHLDTACMWIVGDDPAKLDDVGPWLHHFHISEPNLGAVGAPSGIPAEPFVAALRRWNYDGWLSIEMRQPEPFDLAALQRAAEYAAAAYQL